MLLEHVYDNIRDSNLIKKWTSTDPILREVYHYTQTGWPSHVTEKNLKPYFIRRFELSTVAGCILWGTSLSYLKKLD